MTARPTPLTRAALARHPLPRVEAGDKHDHGRLLVIAGSRDVAGSAELTAVAALRAGAGKLKLATVQSAAPGLRTTILEALVIGLPEARDGGLARTAVKPLDALIGDVDAVVAGPGMIPNAATDRLAAALCKSGKPIALDAAMLRVLLRRRKEAERAAVPPVLLPHAGEMAALLGCDEAEVEVDPLAAGRACAERFDAVTLIKGPQSHVITPDGRAWKYQGGGPGLGVSGSGDVLAGILGGLLARGAEPLTGLLWAVWLHGEAGAALARKVGKIGFLARELSGGVPALLPN